ncbi:MAG: T9SS type A sorting domain-containing protein, partial [Bacteroidetes bacterium]|nr:T9SS type A sorting domain-containing protein [Bacteroidota bacterium]
PNPTTGNVVLELLTADSDKIQIRLLNALGQLVLQQSVSEGATQRRLLLLTEQLPSGVYTVQVENAAGESTFIRLTKAE